MSLLFCHLLVTLSSPADYANPKLLIEASELGKLAADCTHVLDVRSEQKYEAGHIPVAVRVDHDRWAKGFIQHPDRETWSKLIGATGIRNPEVVVVYSDDVKEAVRVWWILRYWGVKDVRLLNGGWRAWQAYGGKITKGPGAVVKPVEIALAPQPARLATRDEILADLEHKHFTLIDTRSEGEYCGDTKLAKRGGAIPGAKHLEWVDLIDRKTQRFKSAPELAKLFKDAGIDPRHPAITYCQSGGRAAVMAFALELMGGSEVRDYYRSWSEWGNAPDTPVVRPQWK
jgi:thiosulfate/3-mercaptopyruvate sulfurtransferase